MYNRSRGDFPVTNSDRFRVTDTKNSIQLAIDHVQHEDAGHYTLYAFTKNGSSAKKDIELIVDERSVGDDPPIFSRRLCDLSVKVGTRTRLIVEMRSSTDVKVSLISYRFNKFISFRFKIYRWLGIETIKKYVKIIE